MYMNLKPNKHKRISSNTMTMASLGFIGPPKILGPPLSYFGLKYLGPPKKIRGGGCYHDKSFLKNYKFL